MALRNDYLRHREEKCGWRSRTYVSGNFCYTSSKNQNTAALFYSEKFEVNADPPAKFTISMKVQLDILTTIFRPVES